MTDSNRVRVSGIRETAFGTLPATPRMRTGRMTGEGLAFTPSFISSNEIRSDRMNADPIKINEENVGPFNFELAFIPDEELSSEMIRSAFFNPWTVTPYRDNDLVADSVITDVATTGTIVTCTAVAPQNGSFVVGALVRFTGFTVAGNNGKFRCTTASATVPAFVASGITNETAPPAQARMKVVGFQGVSGDITAAASSLTSTALDFTTLGLSPGMWLKVGDADNAVFQFGTAANNGWVRISGTITATSIPLDNLPSGWGVDAGGAKTIRVFFGDWIKNGVTRASMSLEKSFLGQGTPTHMLQKGMVVDRFSLDYSTEQIITGSFEFRGLTGTQGTVANGNSYDAAPTERVMSANVSVGQISESGAAVLTPNFVRSLQLQVANNLRSITAVGNVGSVDIGVGECQATGTLEAYFGSNAFLTKLLAGTISNISCRSQIDNQAVILSLPRVTFTGGSPVAGGKNQDVLIPLTFQASIDSVTNSQVNLNRLEYYN
jgi:hypothetical protein